LKRFFFFDSVVNRKDIDSPIIRNYLAKYKFICLRNGCTFETNDYKSLESHKELHENSIQNKDINENIINKRKANESNVSDLNINRGIKFVQTVQKKSTSGKYREKLIKINV